MQNLPADKRAREREEGLVDVGTPIVTDAQATELIQPCERPLDNPPRPLSLPETLSAL